MTIRSAAGGTIRFTRLRGRRVDVHVTDPAGRTVATVVMAEDAAAELLTECDSLSCDTPDQIST